MKRASKENVQTTLVFPSSLGWIAIIRDGNMIRSLTFGHPRRDAAMRALAAQLPADAPLRTDRDIDGLAQRLQAYSGGHPDDFRDVRIDLGGLSPFQRRVTQQCRKIRYGQFLTYGELAAKTGSSRAARAVGNCLAANRVPLIVPCHRVVLAGGQPGAYSAPGGSRMKQRLLALEAAHAGCHEARIRLQ